MHLSHTVLSLAPACLGDTVTTSVFITNVSAVEQVFRFAGKSKYYSRIWPYSA